MVPNALGGFGGIANLVPQNGDMNNGPWRRVELVAKTCAAKWQTTYKVTPVYADNSSIRPTSLRADIVVLFLGIIPITGASIIMSNSSPTPGMEAASIAFRDGATAYC